MTSIGANSVEQLPVRQFSVSAVFDAPRELVWQAWTQRRALMQWFGPKGFTMPAAKLDFYPGGMFHYCLCAPDGNEMWGKFVYRNIIFPERIVLVNSFSDEDGGITRHPMNAAWPLEMLTTITFADASDRTRLTIESEPLQPTDAERKIFDASHQGMQQGWDGTFQQLAGYLTRTKEG